MMQNIRDKASGPLVWFIVGLIVVPFAFFGIETFRTGGGDPTIAKVGDQKITQSQLAAAYDQRLSQLQALMGENFRQDQVDETRLRAAVLDDMVEDLVLRDHMEAEGYRASDAMLFEAIRAIPAFQEDGTFSAETYRNRLSMQGYTPTRFERQLRGSLVIDQMRGGILESAFLPDTAVQQTVRVESQQRELAWARFSAEAYRGRVTVTDEQVAARFEDSRASFRAPERLKVEYVELSLDALAEAESPADDVLRVLYEAEKNSRFTTAEERRASHILVSFGADQEAARARLQAIADQIASGGDFASMAGSHSEDPGSKGQGGDLGWIRRGQMLKSFEEALWALAPGAVSEPVQTEFGWHLIRLDEVKGGTTKPFEDDSVRRELTDLYRGREAERRFQELSESLEQMAFENPDSLAPAAEATGLDLQSSDWFTRASGDGIAGTPALREAAYSPEVLTDNENSRPVRTGTGRAVVVRKSDYEPARPLELDEVSDRIRESLVQEAAREQARSDAEAALAAIGGGATLAQGLRPAAANLEQPGLVGRSTPGIPPVVLRELFRMPRPDVDAPRRRLVDLPGGDVALVVLSKVADGALDPDGDAPLSAKQAEQALAGAEFAAYRQALRQDVDIKYIRRPDDDPAE